MQLLLEYLPVAAFLVAYKFFGGMYVATAVLMIGMPVSLAVLWLRDRKMPAIFAISTALVLVAGTATLVLRDPRFIQWKPTLFLWLLAAAFLISALVGAKTLAQRFMQQILGDTELTRREWLQLNTSWVLYGIVAGAANLVVAFNASENAWVNFKLFGLMGMMFVFMLGQFFWLYQRGKLK